MIAEHIKADILQRIKNAEKEHNVKVIYAIESGSRAWGFASPNSDYDVRFVYVHTKDWYLGIDVEDRRDVIEYEIVDEIDINGWDIRKALKLLHRSNPSIIEWLHSPIVYIDNPHFVEQARALIRESYALDRGMHHYRSMAKTNYRTYLKEDIVPLKKYFYVLRPLLAIRWIEKYKEPAPIEFDVLRTLLTATSDIPNSESLNAEITQLVERKKASQEKENIPKIDSLNVFIEAELTRLETEIPTKDTTKTSYTKFNALFNDLINH